MKNKQKALICARDLLERLKPNNELWILSDDVDPDLEPDK